MESDELNDLRKHWGINDIDLLSLNGYLNKIFDNDLNFNLVIGERERPSESFKTKVIPPLDENSWATVNNFKLGLQNLIKGCSKSSDWNFFGDIYFFGIDSTYRENIGDTILGVSVSEEKNKQSGFLSLILGKSYEKGVVYEAFSGMEKTPIELSFKRFLGPNKLLDPRDLYDLKSQRFL